MSINYDPDDFAEIDPAHAAEAERLGLFPVHVICDEPGASLGDASGVSFCAFVKFIPRIGERIRLENGTTCEVTGVVHAIARCRQTGMISLVPNVYAVRIR